MSLEFFAFISGQKHKEDFPSCRPPPFWALFCVDRNDKSEHITSLDHVVRIITI